MLSPFQAFLGMTKRYIRKPKSFEFYWNFLAFSTLCAFSAAVFFDQEFFSNVLSPSKEKKITQTIESIEK
jgi:hypothetical protein